MYKNSVKLNKLPEPPIFFLDPTELRIGTNITDKDYYLYYSFLSFMSSRT